MANANVRGLIEAATKGARNLQTRAVYHLVSSDEVKKITKKELLESLFDKEELAYLERATELVRDDQTYFQDLRFVIYGGYIMSNMKLGFDKFKAVESESIIKDNASSHFINSKVSNSITIKRATKI